MSLHRTKTKQKQPKELEQKNADYDDEVLQQAIKENIDQILKEIQEKIAELEKIMIAESVSKEVIQSVKIDIENFKNRLSLDPDEYNPSIQNSFQELYSTLETVEGKIKTEKKAYEIIVSLKTTAASVIEEQKILQNGASSSLSRKTDISKLLLGLTGDKTAYQYGKSFSEYAKRERDKLLNQWCQSKVPVRMIQEADYYFNLIIKSLHSESSPTVEENTASGDNDFSSQPQSNARLIAMSRKDVFPESPPSMEKNVEINNIVTKGPG